MARLHLAPPPPAGHNPPQQLQTQQIYIPNDLVGCIIGKGGSKINEIRHMSASQIKIMEPGAVGVGMNGAPAPAGGEGERLVVITGQPANIQMAVQLLYHVCITVIFKRIVLTTLSTAVGAGEAEAAARCVDLSMRKCVANQIISCYLEHSRQNSVVCHIQPSNFLIAVHPVWRLSQDPFYSHCIS